MGAELQRIALDDAFDEAFQHLAECRIAYEDNPRDPSTVEALSAARLRLDESRKAMDLERVRLGLAPRKLPVRSRETADGPAPMAEWQRLDWYSAG
ncbi:MAG: hypothetical protein GY708_01320 [Actinomycetia bacterium]|nr:hypothetical protein [Actinomycetes bacterium]MCP4960565.1 hypothetical protein [Actinomycetes bacterium]